MPRQPRPSALGQHPVQIFQPDRDERHIGVGPGQAKKPAFEGQQVTIILHAAGAFRKKNQAVALIQGRMNGCERLGEPAFVKAAAPIDQDSVKNVVGEKAAQAPAPVVTGSHGPGAAPDGILTRSEERRVERV